MIDRLKTIWRYTKIGLLYILLMFMFCMLVFYLVFHFIVWFITGKNLIKWYTDKIDKVADKIYEQSK